MQMTGLITAPVVGAWVDRVGPRIVAIVGLLGHAAMYVVIARSSGSLGLFYLSFAALAVCASGTLPITWTTVINNWFRDNRGLAIGLTMAGTGLAAGLAPRFVQYLISNTGWRSAYAGIGVTALVISLPVVLLAFRPRPADADSLPVERGITGEWGLTRHEAIQSYRFWALGAALFIITLAINGLIANLVPVLLDDGWSAGKAAASVVFLGPAVVVGRVVAGLLVDRIWAPGVAALFFVQPIIAMLAIASLPMTPFVAVSSAMLLGLAVGAELDLLAFMTSRFFGTRHYGAVFGGIYAFFTVASGLAPLAYARTHDTFGTYRPILLLAALGLVVAIGLLLSLGRYPESRAGDGRTS